MQHDAIAATEQKDADLLRNVLIERTIYTLAEDENPEDFEALDTETGAIPVALAWQEKIWWLDPDDTTSAHDGISVIKTDDDYRYKTSELDLRIRSVLDKDIADPPTSGVMYGDAYLVADGATGDWAGHADDIAVYTARGWLFREPVIGDQIYVEDEDAYYRYKASGEWAIGPGPRAFDDASIPQSALIWDGRVQNQTTNTPPSSASVGVAYIIGSSPTGDWAGRALDIAISEVEDTFTIYEPVTGQIVYDINLGIQVKWNGSEWESASGSVVGFDEIYTAGTGSLVALGSSGWNFSNTVAPTTSNTRRGDSASLNYAAKTVGNILEFRYRVASFAGSGSNGIAIWRDSETTALDWVGLHPTSNYYVDATLRIVAADTDPHDYTIGVMADGSGNAPSGFARRWLSVKEMVP